MASYGVLSKAIVWDPAFCGIKLENFFCSVA